MGVLGNAVATLLASLAIGAEGGRAYVMLVIAPHHKVGPELGRVRRRARLALGLFLAWVLYTLIRIFIP